MDFYGMVRIMLFFIKTLKIQFSKSFSLQFTPATQLTTFTTVIYLLFLILNNSRQTIRVIWKTRAHRFELEALDNISSRAASFVHCVKVALRSFECEIFKDVDDILREREGPTWCSQGVVAMCANKSESKMLYTVGDARMLQSSCALPRGKRTTAAFIHWRMPHEPLYAYSMVCMKTRMTWW